jgi:hypothetical protein
MILFESHSIAQLATMFQVKESTIAKKIAQARRQKISANPIKEARRQQVEKMLKEGKTFEQIGRVLGITRSAARRFAITNGLYTPAAHQYVYGIPIGCRLCSLQPYARGLCKHCYARFQGRRQKKLVEYPTELLILEHPKFKVLYKAGHGYTIHTQFLDTVHISQPTELERILLDHLQRQILQELDEAALEAEYQMITSPQENNDNAA